MYPDYQGIYNQSAAATQGALTNLQNYQSTMQDPSQLYGQAQQHYGVQDQYAKLQAAQGAVNQTTNLINQLPQNVQQAQNGTEMTAAQRGNLMQTELQPLQQQYATATQGLSGAQNMYQNLLGQAQTEAQFGYQGEQQKLASLQDIYQNAFGQQGLAQSNLQWFKQMQMQQQMYAAQEEQLRAQAAAAAAQAAATQQQTGQLQKYYDSIMNRAPVAPSMQNHLANSQAWIKANPIDYNYQGFGPTRYNPSGFTSFLSGLQNVLRTPYRLEGGLLSGLFH